jgi:O-acetylserine/cysteine efflux transporter
MVLIICLPALRIVPGKMRELLTLGVLSGGVFYMFVNGSLAVADNVAALAIAGQLGAPFSLILAVLILKERVHMIRIAGMALAFAGVATLVFDPSAMHEQMGIFLTACSSVVWAVCSLIQRRLIGVPVLSIYAWIGLIGALILAPVAFFYERQSFTHIPDLPLSALGWVLFSALGSTVIGQGAMSWLFQRHPVSTVIPTTLVTPVIAVGVAAWWFHTPVTAIMVVGGIMVLIGVAIVTIRTAQAREIESSQ